LIYSYQELDFTPSTQVNSGLQIFTDYSQSSCSV